MWIDIYINNRRIRIHAEDEIEVDKCGNIFINGEEYLEY